MFTSLRVWCRLLVPVLFLQTGTALAADGDPAAGARSYQQRCGGCHTLDTDRVGPRHRGVVGRKAGGVPGFAYSPALRAATIVWDGDNLDRWLADPQALIPGQQMNVVTRDAKIRADIVAYLSAQSAEPAAGAP